MLHFSVYLVNQRLSFLFFSFLFFYLKITHDIHLISFLLFGQVKLIVL